MDKTQLEFQAVSCISKLAAGEPIDDQLLSLFRALPAHKNAARHLAAYANPARGRPLLWLIGVDPRGKVSGVQERDWESWVSGVREFFEGIPPAIHALDVRVQGKKILALGIETDRAPFVVYKQLAKNGSQRQSCHTEVLWQEAGDIRTAQRVDLIKLISPLKELPMLEILEAELSFWENINWMLNRQAAYNWSLDATLYIVPKNENRLILPFRRCATLVESLRSRFSAEAKQSVLSADAGSSSITETDNALLVNNISQFYLYASGTSRTACPAEDETCRIIVNIHPAGFERAALSIADLTPIPPIEDNQVGKWKLMI